MVSLELKENRLSVFNEVPESNRLDTISLSFNRLVDYNHFAKSPNLTVLILADNKIKVLSRDIIKLSKLKTLDVSNNDLSDLPCEIGFINTLVRIQL
jgi:Leucine-rich repeat (LRR) protein